MNALASTNKQFAEWVDEECRHLDLVASWTTLVEQYQGCSFTDNITDQQRLMEFKQVIKETNKFLTRMRNALSKVADVDSAVEVLIKQFDSKDTENIVERWQLLYNMLKQSWIRTHVQQLQDMKQEDREDSYEWRS